MTDPHHRAAIWLPRNPLCWSLAAPLVGQLKINIAHGVPPAAPQNGLDNFPGDHYRGGSGGSRGRELYIGSANGDASLKIDIK